MAATSRKRNPGISVSEAARTYSCSTRTIRRRIADGTLRAYRVGPKLIRIDPGDLDRMARRIPAAARNGG
jgi:excisionase family DNA binding protein